MRKIFFSSLFLITFSCVISQQINWIDTISYYYGTCPVSLAFDQNQNINVSGGIGSNYCCNPYGIFYHKYNSSGNLLSIDTISCPYNTNIIGGIITSNNQSDLYSALRCLNSSFKMDGMVYSPQTYLIRKNTLGQVLWASPQNFEYPFHISIDNAQNVYVASNVVRKYSSSGVLLNTINFSGHIALDSAMNLYVMSDAIRKFDANGSLIWVYQGIGPNSQFTVDPGGNCYVHQGSAYMISNLLKISSSGQLLWNKTLSFEGSYGMCYYSNSIYLAGIYGSNQTMEGVELQKYDLNGNQSWDYQIYTGANTFDQYKPKCIIANSSGLFLAAAKTENAYTLLIKISEPGVPTKIKQTASEKSLQIAPNPSSSFNITVKGYPEQEFMIKVYDAFGKNILSKVVSGFTAEFSESIDLTMYPRGIYFLELTGEKIREMRKLVVE